MNIPKLIEAAVAYDHGDPRRIQHFLKVYAYADLIGQLEHLAPDTQEILVTAAVLHDIGIHAAEENMTAPPVSTRNWKDRPLPANCWNRSPALLRLPTGSAGSSAIITPIRESMALIIRYCWKPISWSMPMKTGWIQTLSAPSGIRYSAPVQAFRC